MLSGYVVHGHYRNVFCFRDPRSMCQRSVTLGLETPEDCLQTQVLPADTGAAKI